MIFFTIISICIVVGIGMTILVYVRNKQNDRNRHRRERLEEKQGELMDSLRKKNEQPD